MSRYLLIVESPAKAKTIKKYLGNDFKVTASMGHVRDLPQSHLGVDVAKNFEPMYIAIHGKGELIKSLKEDANKSEKVFLATDPDREGEAISWHLAHLLGVDTSAPVRVTFNEITKNAVVKAMEAPRAIDMQLVDAQQARRVLDRIVGYELSPILWKKVRKGLSAGRVQSVATRIVCDREAEIRAFIPQEYWSMDIVLEKETKERFQARFYGKNGKKADLNTQDDVVVIQNALQEASFAVTKVKRSEKKRTPAPPFITSTLQQDASRKLGYSSQRTMMIAQQLYEGVEIENEGAVGLITYMRTDSVRISDDALEDARSFIASEFGPTYLPEKARIFKTKKAAQDAHEAIRPSYVSKRPQDLQNSLSNEQYKLYKLIWDRFLASQMEQAVYDTLSIDITATPHLEKDIETDGIKQVNFRASGQKLVFKGFMALYVEATDDEEDEDQAIPALTEGEALNAVETKPLQHFTQPPPRYTEATLVKAMEEQGIGRPSTYAPTIGTILNRGYVEREKRYLQPTELGLIVNKLMVENFDSIVNLHFTADMENKLDTVEEGAVEWRDLLRDFYTGFKEDVKKAEVNIVKVALPVEESDEICDKCGKKMVIKVGRFGKFLACPGFPECKNTKPFIEDSGVKCPSCGGRIVFRKTKKGKRYIGCEKYPTCTFLSWDLPSGKDCPKCGNFMTGKKKGGIITHLCSDPTCGHTEQEVAGNRPDATDELPLLPDGMSTQQDTVFAMGLGMERKPEPVKKEVAKKTVAGKNTTTKKTAAGSKSTTVKKAAVTKPDAGKKSKTEKPTAEKKTTPAKTVTAKKTTTKKTTEKAAAPAKKTATKKATEKKT